MAIFSETNYELASRPLVDYVVETASLATGRVPVVMQGEDISGQKQRFLAETEADCVLLLEANRPFLQVETLKKFCEQREQNWPDMDGNSVTVATLLKSDKAKANSPSSKELIKSGDYDELLESAEQNVLFLGLPPDSQEAFAIKNTAQLAQAEAMMQKCLCERALQAGVCLQDPDSVTFSFDTVLEPGVVVEPNVVFAPGVRVAQGARIRAFSHLEGANVEAFATVGPYARLRPGTNIGARSRIGNFVEVKQANVEEDAKINHLSYVGDANVGKRANIGAGTITCNFDGKKKHQTNIGDDAFIGSNTSLVAPVHVGKGATVGAGSTITDNVDDEFLAIARARQSNRPRKKDKGN